MKLTDIDLDILKKLGPFKCNNNINFDYKKKIDIPNLVICEYINASSATTLNLPKLESCGGRIDARSATTLNLPKLVSCSGRFGGINAKSATTVNLPNLESCGYIYAESATTVNLPNLVSCSRSINASSATTVDLPKLVSCDWNFNASSATTVNLPKLESCRGHIDAYSAITLNLPKLESCGLIYVGSNTKKIIIPQNLKSKLKFVPDDCEIIHPQTEPKLESFKQYFFRI